MSRFRVTSPGLNLRPQPDAENNTPIGELKHGAVVEKLGESGHWFFVKIALEGEDFKGEFFGWASSQFLTSAALPPVVEAGESPSGEPPSGEPAYLTEFSIDSDLKTRPSPLTAELIDAYLQEKNKPLARIGAPVMAAARKYGINPSYILSHAIHETGWGGSRICREKNNLFGWAASDDDPYGRAGRFPSWDVCIDYVMERVNELYLTKGGRYFREKPCLGNKSYGMNVNYASDSQWGVKIARIAAVLEDWVADQAQPSVPPSGPEVGIIPPGAQSILAAVERVNPEQPYYLKHDITGDDKPETFCNWFVADALELMGVQLPRYDASAGYYPIPHPLYGNEKRLKPYLATSLHKFLNAGGDGQWEKVNRAKAVTLANQGKVVLASIRGHIALVIPGGHGSEVLIAQAGRCCGKKMRLEEGFGRRAVDFFCHTG
jgi:hypothetical protein